MHKKEIGELCSLIIKECKKKDSPCQSSPICSTGKKICAPPVKKAPVKKAPVKKAPVKKAPVKKAPVKKAVVKKAVVKKEVVKKAPSMKVVKNTPVKRAKIAKVVKKAPAKKAPVSKKMEKALSVFFQKPKSVPRTPQNSVASMLAIEDSPKSVPRTPQNSVASMLAIEDSPKSVPRTPQNSLASLLAIEDSPKNVKEMVRDIEEKIMKEKDPSVSFLKASMKQPLVETPVIEEKSMKLVEDYVENVFKKVNLKYNSCDDLENYKKVLENKCVKFLGYDSPDKTSRCVQERFKWLFRDNKELSKNLDILGCKY